MGSVEEIIEFAGVTEEDIVYDLGCGDGRVCIAASRKTGCQSVGIEIEPQVAEKARLATQEAGLSHLVTIIEGDLETTSFSDATLIFVFLLPEALEKLKPLLSHALTAKCCTTPQPSHSTQQQNKKTSARPPRLVSVHFDFGEDWRPSRKSDNGLYLYDASSLQEGAT